MDQANNIDILPSPSQQILLNKLNNLTNQNIDDLEDDDLDNPGLNCKYYNINEFTKANFKSNSNFSILHLNISSIQFHIHELKVILQLLSCDFHIIAISESKLQENIEPHTDISLPGFQTPISTPTASSKGGVLLYVKNGIKFKPREDLKMYKSRELESTFIEIINTDKPNSIIGVIYRHPCMDPANFNESYLLPTLDKLSHENNKQVYISGDFNFDLVKTSSNKDTSDFLDIMTSNLLLPMISLPTKINTGSDTLIDNIFTNQYNPDIKTGNITVGLSDHLPSFLIVPGKNRSQPQSKHNLYKRDTKNFDRENFIIDMLDINWDDILVLEQNDVNLSFNNFILKINTIIDKYMPLRKVTKKEFKSKLKPWINQNILNLIKSKNKIFQKYVQSKNLNKKATLYQQYKEIKNFITQQTRESKKSFYQNYFAENNKNLRKVWEGIKQIISIKGKKR